MPNGKIKTADALSLALILPAPVLGVMAGMEWGAGTVWGRAVFGACKIWILTVPLLWLRFSGGEHVSWSPVRKGGIWPGFLSGLAIAGIVAGAGLTIGRRMIDCAVMSAILREVGLGEPARYIAGALYWILVNSLLEEYVWRWFVFERLKTFFGASGAVIAGSFAFTVHHFAALNIFLNVQVALMASAGIFVGGALWCVFYARYRSIWPGYVSHVMADIGVFVAGYFLLF